MTLTLDASVIVKWLVQDPKSEPDTDKASALVKRIVDGLDAIIQPPHWLAEVAAVLTRLSPKTAADDVEMLAALELPIAAEPTILRRATILAVKSGQHVFDTYYHAVALESEGVLITADDRYISMVKQYGRIESLKTWTLA